MLNIQNVTVKGLSCKWARLQLSTGFCYQLIRHEVFIYFTTCISMAGDLARARTVSRQTVTLMESKIGSYYGSQDGVTGRWRRTIHLS